jgi:hypothetical protein
MPHWSYHATVTACTGVQCTTKIFLYNFLNPTPPNTTLLVVRQWRKLLPRLAAPLSVISHMQTNSMSLSWVTWLFLGSSSYYNDIKRSKDEYTRHCWQQETCNLYSSSDN